MSLRQLELTRHKVIWYGADPPVACASLFTERGLDLELHRFATNAIIDLREVRAAVFAYDPRKPRLLEDNLLHSASAALDHGAKLIAVADSASFRQTQAILRRIELGDRVEPLLLAPEYQIAQSAAQHRPGPKAVGGLVIVGDQLSPGSEILFQRAFADCRQITVTRLPGGWSADVFCVHALLADHDAGPRPLPFLAKVDSREKIDRELVNYDTYVSGFVPFGNRPNLAHGRCVCGATQGILVGTYVERSDSLVSVAKRGEAASAIYSLFDEALRGWRLQALHAPQYVAYSDEKAPQSSVAQSFIMGNNRRTLFEPRLIQEHRRNLARRLGVTRTPEQLRTVLLQLPPIPHRRGPIHGDLHASNICIHKQSAILIDFYSTEIGPMVMDPAALEVSLVFDGFAASEAHVGGHPQLRHSPRDEWMGFVDDMYCEEYLVKPPPSAVAPDPREWLWNVVRQIRMLALASTCHAFEYTSALAIQLLRRASHRAVDPGDDFRRAYAYLVADRLLP